jgi:hypothetical protein
MSEELKLCPFCEEKIDVVIHLNSKGDTFEEIIHPFVRKSNCPLRLSVFLREQWQSRPLEDALRKQLKEMTYERDAYQFALLGRESPLKKQLEVAVEAIQGAIYIYGQMSYSLERDVMIHHVLENALAEINRISTESGVNRTIDNEDGTELKA